MLMVTYWLDLFTGTTWEEFRKSGANVSGFRESRKKAIDKVKTGDILLCYTTGIMHWVGALEVIGPSNDTRKIWNLDDNSETLEFPARIDVKPIIILDPEYGVPMAELEGKVSFYQNPSDRLKGFKGFVRGSLSKFRNEDGELVFKLLTDAEEKPKKKRIDPKRLRKVPLYKTKKGKVNKIVSVPDSQDESNNEEIIDTHRVLDPTEHTQIQYYLLDLGSKMGLNVRAATNDSSKEFNGVIFASIPNTISELPLQFNEATQKTIELIDVLWLKGNTIVAAFEIESTTSIYSGLLRMSDLIALQPNLDIKLYLVAPDTRGDKVKREILRPTFEYLQKPLSKMCGFIPFSDLKDKTLKIQELGIARHLNPNFLNGVAEYFTAEGEYQE